MYPIHCKYYGKISSIHVSFFSQHFCLSTFFFFFLYFIFLLLLSVRFPLFLLSCCKQYGRYFTNDSSPYFRPTILLCLFIYTLDFCESHGLKEESKTLDCVGGEELGNVATRGRSHRWYVKMLGWWRLLLCLKIDACDGETVGERANGYVYINDDFIALSQTFFTKNEI